MDPVLVIQSRNGPRSTGGSLQKHSPSLTRLSLGRPSPSHSPRTPASPCPQAQLTTGIFNYSAKPSSTSTTTNGDDDDLEMDCANSFPVRIREAPTYSPPREVESMCRASFGKSQWLHKPPVSPKLPSPPKSPIDCNASPMTIIELISRLSSHLEQYSEPEVIIVDVRESRYYQTSHIITAKSANCYTKTMTKRAIATWAHWFPNHNGGLEVLLYDQKGEYPATSSPLNCYIQSLTLSGNVVYFLEGGFERFKQESPSQFIETCMSQDVQRLHAFSPTNSENNSEDVLNATASKILSFLYLGNERDSHDLDLLDNFGITHILNVTNIVPFYFENTGQFKYHRLEATDSHLQDLRKFYNEAFAFIDAARQSNGHVLVHCWAGVSRSTTIVMAYLMKHSRLSVPEVLHCVRTKRPIIGPNLNFMGQLERFYADLNNGVETRTNLLDNEIQPSLEDGTGISSGGSDESGSDHGSWRSDQGPPPVRITCTSAVAFLK